MAFGSIFVKKMDHLTAIDPDCGLVFGDDKRVSRFEMMRELSGVCVMNSEIAGKFIVPFCVLVAVYLTSFHNYLLFHTMAEVFAILIAVGIFFFAWNTRKYQDNHYYLFLGIAYLFVGVIDFAHMLSYKGIGVFPGIGTNVPTQLWIAARYLESISLLSAFLFFRRKLHPRGVFLLYLLITTAFFFTIYYLPVFPDCHIEGKGLTPFKKISEYIICLMLLLVVYLFFRYRRQFEEKIFRLLITSAVLTVLSELSFTFYVSVYGFSNLVGHLLKIISFYLIYKAVIETGLSRPYDLLFKELKQSEKTIRDRELRLKNIVNSAVDGIISINQEGRIEMFNPGAERLFGYKAAEVMGRDVGMLAPEPVSSEHGKYISSYLNSGEKKIIGTRREVMAQRKGGKTFPMYLSVSETHLEGERSFIGIVHDITDTKKIEEQYRTLFPQNSVTAESYGVKPLMNGFPDEFKELVTTYQELMDAQIEQTLYKVQTNISKQLRIMGKRLGSMNAGPRDIIDIHRVALDRKTASLSSGMTEAYVNESRLMILELMGHVISYYRKRGTSE